MYICSSTARDIFLGILYGYKMVMQVIALVLAFINRKVKVKGLDDAKYIAAAIYVTSIVLAVVIVATYSLKDFVNAFPTLFCTGFIIGTTSILGLVFVPKVGRFVRQVTNLVSVYMLGFTYHQYVGFITASNNSDSLNSNSEDTHAFTCIHINDSRNGVMLHK